jgi:hypothetical protein
MTPIEILWPPHPHRAGFCITDDTDAATMASVRGVYDFLASIGLRTSKTVWALEPTEPCGIPPLPDSILRGITLEDPSYLAYCAGLAERGFEICLHGASAGNNVRARTARALERIERHFGGAGTYICHAKNAENPYWHEKVAPRGPARWALAPLSRYRCSGEDPASPYFWGDLCLAKIRHIRLFRTRDIDTLARNPSMPYFDPEKPLVRSWFAATKRSFHDCTTDGALSRLEAEHGLCVLYQYMHRYADPATGRLDEGFRADAERLMARASIWVDTTSRLMDRLRLIQGVFVTCRGREVWVANANLEPVDELQLRLENPLVAPPPGVHRNGTVVRIERIDAGRLVRLETQDAVSGGARVVGLDTAGHGAIGFGFGRLFVNAGASVWEAVPGVAVPAMGCVARFEAAVEALRPMRRASAAELYALLAGQLGIIGHEILWKGRSPSSKRFLGAEKIELEDHANW